MVKLLQQWTTQSYNPLLKKKSISDNRVPRNSKSTESFQLRRPTASAYTPTSFSTYLQTPSPCKSVSVTPSSQSYISKFDLLSSNNKSYRASPSYVETVSQPKYSRFKMVREKLLRKPSLLSNQAANPKMKQSKSIDSSVSKLVSTGYDLTE